MTQVNAPDYLSYLFMRAGPGLEPDFAVGIEHKGKLTGISDGVAIYE